MLLVRMERSQTDFDVPSQDLWVIVFLFQCHIHDRRIYIFQMSGIDDDFVVGSCDVDSLPIGCDDVRVDNEITTTINLIVLRVVIAIIRDQIGR